MIAALFLSLLQPSQEVEQPATAHWPAPGARTTLAGMAGFQIVSKIDFGTAQNRLTAAYTFPDRARWHFEPFPDSPGAAHQFFYRSGGEVNEFSGGQPSKRMEDEARDTILLQMELRRAVMFWPDGFTWEDGTEGCRRAQVHADSCCRGGWLGDLLARESDDGTLKIEARNTRQESIESLEVRSWREQGGRSWPSTLVLHAGGSSFVETLESIETRIYYLEPFFLPPDRRRSPEPSANGPEILAEDLVAMTFAAHDLPEGLSWEECVSTARRLGETTSERLHGSGLSVDPVPTFELSLEGHPVRCLIRLTQAVHPAPAGFVTRQERIGLFCPLGEIASVGPAVLQRLSAAAPEGARAGTPYLRIHSRASLPIELVLPIEPMR